MGISKELTPAAQDLLDVEKRLIVIGIPIKDIGTFGPDDPCCQAATRPGFSDHRIRNVLESFLPAGDISKGIEDLKEIRCRYFAAQEHRREQDQTHKKNKHKNKHH